MISEGKSTLALALLRGITITGQVFYDDKDITKVNLDALRSSMTLIPQQPEVRRLFYVISQNLIVNHLTSAVSGNIKRKPGSFLRAR